MAEALQPPALPADTAFAKSIAGEHLFGEEIDLWISAIVLDGELGPNASVDNFRATVEAHWARGAQLLKAELEECGNDDAKLVSRLSEFLPEVSPSIETGTLLPSIDAGEIRLKVGSVSRTYPEGEEVELILNGQGTSPHIALMGQTGTGKSRTGVDIMRQVLEKTHVPALVIDPKGEFVREGRLSGWLEGFGVEMEPIEVGKQPIPLDFLPEPSVGNVSIQNAAMQFRDSIALCCKGAGNIQQDLLRSAIDKVIRHVRPRSLEAVKEYYKAELDAQEKGLDSIMSRLNELTGLKCFTPEMPAGDFFSRSWILSLKAIGTEELKRLVILLVLDTLKGFLLTQNDAPVNSGYRSLRHVFMIDEARRILAEKKYQSLVDIIRQGRSKGCVVILLSQDPSDFEGQADDFTTQLGSCLAFACLQTRRGLRALQGVYGRKLLPSEFADTWLPKWVAFSKLPGRSAERITCWDD
jgi:hypothetical protein